MNVTKATPVKLTTSDSADYMLNHVPRWPLFMHAFSAVVCLGCSAIYHLFNIKNKLWYQWFTLIDYSGICFLIMGTPYPLINYAFACEQVNGWRYFFLGFVSITCAVVLAVMFSPFFMKPESQFLRTIVFGTLACSVLMPMIYLGSQRDMTYLSDYSMMPWALGMLTYMVGAVIYANRAPEKCKPGVFDYCGASHQIFHCLVVVGALIHFSASLDLYYARIDKVCPVSLVDY